MARCKVPCPGLCNCNPLKGELQTAKGVNGVVFAIKFAGLQSELQSRTTQDHET